MFFFNGVELTGSQFNDEIQYADDVVCYDNTTTFVPTSATLYGKDWADSKWVIAIPLYYDTVPSIHMFSNPDDFIMIDEDEIDDE